MKEHGGLILALDLGTTACKAGVFNCRGNMLSSSYVEYPLVRLDAGFIEQDAEDWWQVSLNVLMDAVSGLNSAVGKNAWKKIEAMSISAQGISFLPVDGKGNPLRRAISWLDHRAEKEANELKEHLGTDKFWQETGLPVHSVYTLPKILWLKRNEPEVVKKCQRFATSLDFLMQRFTGVPVTDHSIAAGTLMQLHNDLCWWKELLCELGIEYRKLPEVAWAGSKVYQIKPEIAKTIGVPEDLQVVLGGHDQECAAIGAGLCKGRITVSMGTASILIGSADHPLYNPQRKIPSLPSVREGEWVLEAPVNVGGAALNWWKGIVGDQRLQNGSEVSYELLVKIATNSPPGSKGVMFFPHMTGATSPFWNTGVSGVFWGLTLSAGLPEMIRSVLEGWIYQINTNLVNFERLIGPIHEVVIFGGGARSHFIARLLADITGYKVRVPKTTETALLGAAIIAAEALYTGTDQAAMVSFGPTFIPDAGQHLIYKKLYRQYRTVEDQILKGEEE